MDVMEWIEKSRREVMEGAELNSRQKHQTHALSELILELTYGCNMRCRMCNIWGKYRKDSRLPTKEMSVEEVVDYIEESKILKNIRTVIISGGEPFLKRGIVDLIGHFIDSYTKIEIGILSNLYSTSRTISSLKEVEKRFGTERVWIGTSLDGLQVSHNNTRGITDAFEKFNVTLLHLKQEFPSMNVTVNFTLTTDNYRDLYSTYMFCREHNLAMSVQFPVSWKEAENFTFSEKDVNEIESQILKIIAEEIKSYYQNKCDEKGLMAKIFYLYGLIDYQRHPRRVFEKCVAGRSFVTFSPEGEVYLCPVLKKMTVGDLRETPFDEIWEGKETNKLRKKIDSGFCHCWLNCTIYPSTGDALNVDRRKPKKKKGLDSIRSLLRI